VGHLISPGLAAREDDIWLPICLTAAAQELSGATGDKQQQQKQGSRQADDSFDNALVTALQSYFHLQPR